MAKAGSGIKQIKERERRQKYNAQYKPSLLRSQAGKAADVRSRIRIVSGEIVVAFKVCPLLLLCMCVSTLVTQDFEEKYKIKCLISC